MTLTEDYSRGIDLLKSRDLNFQEQTNEAVQDKIHQLEMLPQSFLAIDLAK